MAARLLLDESQRDLDTPPMKRERYGSRIHCRRERRRRETHIEHTESAVLAKSEWLGLSPVLGAMTSKGALGALAHQKRRGARDKSPMREDQKLRGLDD